MEVADEGVLQVLSLIDDAKLPHPWGPFLAAFITEALNPQQAADYARSKLAAGQTKTLVSDWRYIIESFAQHGARPPPIDYATRAAIVQRDAARCCITGRAGTWWDPLVVLPVNRLPCGWITDRPNIHAMLGAFFGGPYRDWWLLNVEEPGMITPLGSHWLVRRSANSAFARGLLKLDRLAPSMIEYEVNHVLLGAETPIRVRGLFPLLGDHSRNGITKVDPPFLGTQARLSRSIRFLDVAKANAAQSANVQADARAIAFGAETATLSHSVGRLVVLLSQAITRPALTLWLCLPGSFRVRVYELLRGLGARIYGRPEAIFRNEFSTLQTLRRHTSVPAPTPLDLVVKPRPKDDAFADSDTYLLMTCIPGYPLATTEFAIPDSDFEVIRTQLQGVIVQLRSMSSQKIGGKEICNTMGQALADPRIRGGVAVGPFADEAEFNQSLRFSDDPARRGHKIVFTHADLNPRNILVDRQRQPDGSLAWRLSGIVDWETAGFLPEYWAYTKALFEGFRWSRRYNDMIHGVFSAFGDYSRELAVERQSWESGDGV